MGSPSRRRRRWKWFRKRRPPPNIDDLIRKAQGSVGKIFPGGRGSNKPIYLGILVLVVLWALSGLYRVLPDEQGVVLRFGKFTKSTQPGLNYHIPFPVEKSSYTQSYKS